MEFRVGDRVRVLDARDYSSLSNGDEGIIIGEKHGSVGWLFVEGVNESGAGWKKGLMEKDGRWELIKPGKAIKEKPIDRHVVFRDDCHNYVGYSSSFEDAVEMAKGKTENMQSH